MKRTSPLRRQLPRSRSARLLNRRGVVAVAAAFALVAVFGFVAFAVDTGRITSAQTQMQNAADAAALAASQEISTAIAEAGDSGSTTSVDGGSPAIARARAMAEKIAAANGVYIDPARDVRFGHRSYNEVTQSWPIQWDQGPYNVVKVTAHRDNADASQPDGALKLSFGWAVGRPTASLVTSSTAFVESRDLVIVLDYSASMSDDSEFGAIDKLGRTTVENNLREIYTALEVPNAGNLQVEPQWLTLNGSGVAVTFRDPGVYVVSQTDIKRIKVKFTNGSEQTFTSNLGREKEVVGTGSNSDRQIVTVWVDTEEEASDDPVLVRGQNSNPYITVTFDGTRIDVTSTKDLSNVVMEFEGGAHQKIEGLSGHSGSFSGSGSNSGKKIVKAWIKSGSNHSGDGPGYGERFVNPQTSGSNETKTQRFDDTDDHVKTAFGLNGVAYPYPAGSWDEFITYTRQDNSVRKAGYGRKYGGMTFASYLLAHRYHHHQTPDLWKTPHYPFHAVKNGASLFLDFLQDLDFGDEVGLVTYDEEARIESRLSEDGVNINLSSDPVTSNYAALNTIQRHKQAGHYGTYTGMGYGVKEARQLLFGGGGSSGYARDGARATIVLMTDGLANQRPNGWSLPGSFRWSDWTDYNGDGNADYSTSDRNKQYAFWEAVEAIKSGATIHTLSVGAEADTALMRAIAFAGGGVAISVPGGTTIAEMESQLLEAFATVASKTPPPKLIYDAN